MEDGGKNVKKEDVLKHSTCAACKTIVNIFKDGTDFGIYNGHILNKKLTVEFDMPCLCGTPVFLKESGKAL